VARVGRVTAINFSLVLTDNEAHLGRIVTSIKAQKRNKDRVSIYLDGEYAFGLARIVAAWLHVGQELSEEKITQLTAQDEVEAAYARALRLLSQRDHTTTEIRQNLKRHELAEPVIDDVIGRLERAGLINDERFAQNWIDNRSEFRPRSRRALAYELRARGVAPEAFEEALGQTDEEEMAYRAGRKQSSKYQQLLWPEYRQKMIAFLARRGFSYGISAPVVQRIWQEKQAESDQGNATTEYEEVNS
jgi:regulatory protein